MASNTYWPTSVKRSLDSLGFQREIAPLTRQMAERESEQALVGAGWEPVPAGAASPLPAPADSLAIPVGNRQVPDGAASPLPAPEPTRPLPSVSLPSLDEVLSRWLPARQEIQQVSTGAPMAGPPAQSPAGPPAARTGTPFPMPTGRPQGPATAAVPTGEIIEGDPQGFFASARPYAEAAEREFGVPAALSLAIAANETGYGQRRYMAGDNNYHGIQDTTGTGTPYRDWRPGPNGEKIYYEARQAGFESPLEGFRGFARFLTENPRYAPALDRYRQTGDVNQLAADIHRAGYAEDPAYTTKITSILRGIPEPTGVGEVTAAPGVRPGERQSAAPPDQSGAFSAGGWTPNQYDASKAEGLDDETAWAVCGPAAAIAFARRNGRNPTMREALGLAQQVGWTPQAGMAGPASQQQLLQRMGVAARLVDGAPDWQAVAQDVERGNPVIVSTPGHYFVAERYDPKTGNFDFGNSATILRRSGGRRWFRPDELAGLGMGSPRASLFLDNPASPAPSSVAGRVSLNGGASPYPGAPPSAGVSAPGAAPDAALGPPPERGVPPAVAARWQQRVGQPMTAEDIEQLRMLGVVG